MTWERVAYPTEDHGSDMASGISTLRSRGRYPGPAAVGGNG